MPYLKCRHRDNLKRHVIETAIVAFPAVGFQVKYLFQILLSCDFHGVFSCILSVNKSGMQLLVKSFHFSCPAL